jgi:MFS family permease
MSPLYAGAIFAGILVVGSLLQPMFGKFSDTRERKPLVLIVLFATGFFALFAGFSDSLTWAILGLLPSIAILTAVRPVVLAAAVEYSAKSESTTLGIVFTVLDGVGMAGALCAGLAGEIELGYAFVLGGALAFGAAVICIFLRFPKGELPPENARISPVASPADP